MICLVSVPDLILTRYDDYKITDNIKFRKAKMMVF